MSCILQHVFIHMCIQIQVSGCRLSWVFPLPSHVFQLFLVWCMVKDKILTMEKSAEAVCLPKPALSLANNKLALVTDWPEVRNKNPAVANENPATH